MPSQLLGVERCRWRCGECGGVHGGVQRCTEGLSRCAEYTEGCIEVHGDVQRGVHRCIEMHVQRRAEAH